MLAGPNGSGKSTLQSELKPTWIGVFVNADKIERALRDSGGAINLDRVRRRVMLGGHPVPEDKVRKRYRESIDLMSEACAVAVLRLTGRRE